MAKQQRFEEGSVLFHQGDASDCVFQIKSGAVSVIKELNGEQIVLGRLEAGEFLGEMGVLEDLDRSATAIAVLAVDAEIYEKNEFLELVAGDSALALNLLRRLSARLRDMNNLLASASGHSAAAGTVQPATVADDAELEITLRGATYALQFYIGAEPIVISRFPYSVGRFRDLNEGLAHPEPDLLIDDPQPYRLSPIHFVIEREHGNVMVRDCNTELGTIVNGRSLGRDFPVESLALNPGDNEIVAGGESSPYHFTATITN
ncbi:MAG: cyclic nucleotide-binding domain-containing protein [Alphaproteobacteria bacterium]|nr:cyclic nucleotide-binding domain-containing protein [Alphaproteobacteria bacterium]